MIGFLKGTVPTQLLAIGFLSTLPAVHALALAAENPPAVTLKHLEPAEIVCAIHKGPYWQLGKVYADLGDVLADAGQDGPIYARYLDNPNEVDDSDLRIEVGFFVNNDIDVRPPYRRKTLPQRTVASLVVECPFSLSPGYHRNVFDWIESNGYTRLGKVTEVYHTPPGRKPTVEIQVPIRAVNPSRQRKRPVDVPHADARDSVNVSPPSPAIEKPPAFRAATVRERTPTQAVPGWRDFGADIDVVVDEQLVPDQEAFPAAHRKWFVDILDRLLVIRELVRARWGTDEQAPRDVNDLITAVAEQAAWLRRGPLQSMPAGTPDTPAVAEDVTRRKQEIIRRLDRLMVQTHLKKLAPSEVLNEVTEVMKRIHPIVHPTPPTSTLTDADTRILRRQSDPDGSDL